MAQMRVMMARLGLAVNEDKTGIVRLPEQSVEFLGYTIGRCYSKQSGRAYIGTRPSNKSVRRVMQAVRASTAPRTSLLEADVIVGRLNRVLVGWGNYFCLGPVSPAYRAVDAHARYRLRQWSCRKHKRRPRRSLYSSDTYLYDTLGLVCLPLQTRNLPWAKA